MTAAEISQCLTLDSISSHSWHVQACCALTGEGWVLSHLTLTHSVCHYYCVWVNRIFFFTNIKFCLNNLFLFALSQSACQSGLDEVTGYCKLEHTPVDQTSSNWANLERHCRFHMSGINSGNFWGKILWTWRLWYSLPHHTYSITQLCEASGWTNKREERWMRCREVHHLYVRHPPWPEISRSTTTTSLISIDYFISVGLTRDNRLLYCTVK